MQPTTNPTVPSTPPTKNRRRLFAIIGGAIIFLIIFWSVVIAGVMHYVSHRSDLVQSGQTYKTGAFKDQLAPTSEIKVGDYRYVSACQALTAGELANIFGTFTDSGYITERYLDQSVTAATDNQIDTNCDYSINTRGIRLVRLSTSQYTDIDRARSLSLSMTQDATSVKATVARYKQAVEAANGGADVKAFVAKLEQSAKTYEQYDNTTGDEHPGVNFDGLVIPAPDLELGHEFKLMMINKNVVYELTVGLTAGPDKSVDYTDKQITAILTGINATLETVKKNANNAALSQSPAPTIIGKHDKIGSTQILEPCVLLNNAAYKAITGLDANETVSRNSVIYTAEKAQKDKYGDPLLPSNSCGRSYTDGKHSDGFSTTHDTHADLDLTYSPTVAGAQKYAEGIVGTKDGSIDLQTTADWARSLPFGDDGRMYIFRVGSYVGDISISTNTSDGLDSEIVTTYASQADHIKAINELVTRLKQQK